MAGVIWGISEENELDDFQTCLSDADTFFSKILLAVHMLLSFEPINMFNGADLLMATLAEIPHYAFDCYSGREDASLFLKWLAEFAHPKEVAKQIEANLMKHKAALAMDLAKVRRDLKHG